MDDPFALDEVVVGPLLQLLAKRVHEAVVEEPDAPGLPVDGELDDRGRPSRSTGGLGSNRS